MKELGELASWLDKSLDNLDEFIHASFNGSGGYLGHFGVFFGAALGLEAGLSKIRYIKAHPALRAAITAASAYVLTGAIEGYQFMKNIGSYNTFSIYDTRVDFAANVIGTALAILLYEYKYGPLGRAHTGLADKPMHDAGKFYRLRKFMRL